MEFLEDENNEYRPVFYGMRDNPWGNKNKSGKSKLHDRQLNQIFNPDPLRSHIITLHLYIEYWLDQILSAIKCTNVDQMGFYKKTLTLKEADVIDESLFSNIISINRLRNVYAHELDLDKANPKVWKILESLRVDPYFESSDRDHFRSICIHDVPPRLSSTDL